jgi:hypothetical protein
VMQQASSPHAILQALETMDEGGPDSLPPTERAEPRPDPTGPDSPQPAK